MDLTDLNKLDNVILYKYFSIKNLGYLIDNSKLYIDKIDSWEDCYENFFLKCNFIKDGYNVEADNLIPGVFGQSWTTKKESDAMWRIYSNDKCGIKIKTTAKKLFKVYYIDDECMANTWFGKVKYDSMQDIINSVEGKIKQQMLYEVFQYTFPETEFMKRTEFWHEEEFRVVVMLDSQRINKHKGCRRLAYNIDVSDFIDEFCLDPRLSDTEFDEQKEKLIKLGVNGNKIIKSNLYDFKPYTFKISD